jgi:hypothetical protein
MILQEWRGWIEEIKGDAFWAILRESEDDEQLQFEMPVSLVPEEDREFLQPGAYLTVRIIGENEDDEDASCEIEMFRERWTQEDIDKALEAGKKMAREMGWE